MTVVPRGNSFGCKVWDAGKRRYRWLGTFKTEAQALQAEANATVVGPRCSIANWCRVWLSDYARPASTTQASYRYAVNRITKELGERDLSSITRPEAKRIANDWPAYTRTVAAVIWADAVREGLTEVNPWANMRFRKSKGRKDLKALTESEIAELAQMAFESHEYHGAELRALVLFMAYVGVRPCEMYELRWSDVDRANGELTVGPKKHATKSRRIIIPPLALDALLALPESIDRSRHLFLTVRGRPISKSNLKYVFKPLQTLWRAKHGQHITPYHLRHACATLMLERGLAPFDVAHQLGHKDGGVLVQTVYGHPADSAARERAKLAFSMDAPQRVVDAGRRSA